jgi:hypothetical protein
MDEMVATAQICCSFPKVIKNSDSNVLTSWRGMILLVQRAERSLKSSVPLLNPSIDPSLKVCFQMRPNSKSGDDMVRVMSFAMLSSVTSGGSDGVVVAVDADTGTAGNTAGSNWLTGFFFNAVFFSGMVTYDVWQWCHKKQCVQYRTADGHVKGCRV